MRRTDGDCRRLQEIRHGGKSRLTAFVLVLFPRGAGEMRRARLLCPVIGWKGGGYEFSLDNDMEYIHYLRESMGESHASARFYHLACWYVKSAGSCRVRYYLLSGLATSS